LFVTCIGLLAVKNNERKIDEVLKVPAEKPISVGCYQAIYEEDTLDLKINTFKNGEVTGYGYGNF
jgi:hypothetical protein